MTSMFPSPSGASHFQIIIDCVAFGAMGSCFRPLPGHLISKYKEENIR